MNRRARLWVAACFAAGASGLGCWSKTIDGTSFVVTVSFTQPVDHLVFSGTTNGGEAFPTATAPSSSGTAALESPQSVRILLSDALNDDSVVVSVTGMSQGAAVSTGSASAVVQKGNEVDLNVTLVSGSPQDGGTDGGSDGGVVDAGVCGTGLAVAGPMTEGLWTWEFPLPTGNFLSGVWASSDCEVWAVGGAGTALHKLGATWTSVPTGVPVSLTSVWGTGPDDVWAVGECGTILHWNGSSWTPSVAPNCAANPLITYAGVYGTDAGVWAVGASTPTTGTSTGVISGFTSGAWTAASTPSAPPFLGVWMSGATDGWAVTSGEEFWHYNGASWMNAGGPGSTDLLLGVYGFGPGDAWAVGAYDGGALFQLEGSTWKSAPLSVPVAMYGLWGTSDSSFVAVGGDVVNGGYAYAPGPTVQHSLPWLKAVAGVESTVWAVGNAGAVFRGGLTAPLYSELPSDFPAPVKPITTMAISQSATEAWASTNASVVFTLGADGGWSPYAVPPDSIYALWQPTPGDVYGAGHDGVLVHTTGNGTWETLLSSGFGTSWEGISGRLNVGSLPVTYELWLVRGGAGGPALGRINSNASDGGGFTPCPTTLADGGPYDGGTGTLWSVSVVPGTIPSGGVVAVGDSDTIIERVAGGAGTIGTCTATQGPSTNRLRSVWVSPSGTIWAAGDNWTVIQSPGFGQSWTVNAMSGCALTGVIYVITGNASEVWVAGQSGQACYSSNGGVTWTQEAIGSSNNVRAAVSLVAGNIRMVGDNTSILRRGP